MLRLAGASQVVVLAREEDDLGRYAEMLQSAEPLLALLYRYAIIIVRMQDQRRRLDVLRPLERRAVPVQIELLEYVTAEVALVPVSSVSSAVVANEVNNAAKRHRRFEHIRVTHDPVGHVAAVASSSHAQPVAIDP